MKIIYGRAGTGKSEYVFDSIKKSTAKKIYIITPEQFSFTAEKRLVDTLEEGATTKVEVLSFERMAYRVIQATVKNMPGSIGKSGKAMIIYEAINKNKKELKFLGKSLENIDLIITQITEFKKHNVTPEMLEKQVNSTQNEYLKAKLNDMLIMYRELENVINIDSNQLIDENDLLTILNENIEKSHLFDDSTFYIDEFAGFTKQEYSIIEKLNKIAKELYITVCTDELKITKPPEADIFYDNKQTIQSLQQICEFEEKNQICLEKNYRFKNQELEHLEKNIFATPYRVYDKENKNIELYLAENQYSETEYVASKIVKLVRDENYRYNDIAVICNNLDQYSSLCKAIFSEYEIPVFIDEKKDITQNILIRYITSFLDIFSKNWSYDAVFNYIKTGLTNVTNVYELENYCLKWGIQGKKWYEKAWDYENANESISNNFNEEQQKIVKPLVQLRENIYNKKTAKEISKCLYDFMDENLLQTEYNEIKTIIDKPENIDAWNIIVDIFEEIIQLFGDNEMKVDEYLKILKTGLSTKELGQIPQTQDKVTVGDVNRSKSHKVKAVFIIGVNDGAFPSNIGSEGFLNDKDRENLKNEGMELAKGTKEKMYEENFNIYKAFTTAEEKLYISYSSSDSDGKALRKSLIISKIKRIFPKLEEKSGEIDEILTTKITFEKLLNNLENKEWFEVYNWYKNNYPEMLKSAMCGLNYSNVPEQISQENIDKLYGNNLKTSISKLESYESCPFSYYLKYGLKLSDKEKLDIKPIDTGSFMHEVIDEFFKKIKEYDESNQQAKQNLEDSSLINQQLEKEQSTSYIKFINDEEIEKLVNQIIENKISLGGKFTLTAKYRILVQRLKRVITTSMKYIIESLRNSNFDVLGTEISFGGNNDNQTLKDKIINGQTENHIEYPPIEMKLDNGKKVSIIGKIDRIDIAKMTDGKYIRIIDYKSSTKDIDLNKVIAGLQLQLITYVDAICQKEDVMPAGALYFTLLEPKIASSKREITKEEILELIKQNYRMNGLVLADVNIIKSMDTDLQKGKSDVIPVTLNESGEINYSRSSTVTKEEFEKLQRYANRIIKKISNDILSGKIDLKPYYSAKEKRTPCSYCEYKSICQFNPKFKGNGYRYIPNDNKQKILDDLPIHNN